MKIIRLVSQRQNIFLHLQIMQALCLYVHICVISVSKIRFLHEQCLEYLHLSDLTIMLLFRFVVYRNKIQFLSADKKKRHPSQAHRGAFLDVSIMNGFETVTRLGGYILMFPFLSACISHFWNMKNLIGYTLSGILELTTGL